MARCLIEMSTLSQQWTFNPIKRVQLNPKTSRSSYQILKSLGSFAALEDVYVIPKISEIETIEISTFAKAQNRHKSNSLHSPFRKLPEKDIFKN